MTRFEMDLAGKFGEYWKKDALAQIAKMSEKVEKGEISTDANGAAYWTSVGRYLPEDCAIILTYTGYEFSLEATNKARKEETAKDIAAYVKSRENRPCGAEERYEMQAAFGAGAKIMNVLTGEIISL